MKTLFKMDEAAAKLKSGKAYMVAGEERLLRELPKGPWIGGTIPYFMSEDGGLTSENFVQLQELPVEAKVISQKTYSASQLKKVAQEYPENGFSMVILPGLSNIHLEFGRDVFNYDGVFNRPLTGWVSGIHLDKLGKETPKAMNGSTGEITDQSAVVMHLDLPKNLYAKVDTLNLFSQGTGDTLEFDDAGFKATTCKVNGKPTKFGEYLQKINFDIKLPLVANYSGANINVSIQAIDPKTGDVSFYNAVQRGITYRFAKSLTDYPKKFQEMINKDAKPFFSCNCVLNYLYANLEGKKTGHSIGPMTFGEVAYVLHNQTMVYITIEKK